MERTPLPRGKTRFLPRLKRTSLSICSLTPELAEDITAYDRVCFVDAHTGKIPENVQVVDVAPEYQTSPFTHHLTPEMLLSMSQELYQKIPEAILVSVRGYEFGFETELSPFTSSLVTEAVERTVGWLKAEELY
ncbi:MAG: hypothetical protein QM730_23500 [Anaerolineales bacterium]